MDTVDTSAIRRFTRIDWYGWAGCERFQDDTEPFICELRMSQGLTGLVLAFKSGDSEPIDIFTRNATPGVP